MSAESEGLQAQKCDCSNLACLCTVMKVDGRYETGLLWRNDSQLHNNRFYAERHLASLLQRHSDTPDLKTTHEAGIESDIKKGYIRKISPEEHH